MIAPNPQADSTDRLDASHHPSRAIAPRVSASSSIRPTAVSWVKRLKDMPRFQRRTRSRNGADRRRLRARPPGGRAPRASPPGRPQKRRARRGRRARAASRKAAERPQFAQRLGVARTDVREIGRGRRRIEIAPRARAFDALRPLDHDRDVRQLRQTESVPGRRAIGLDRDVRGDADLGEIDSRERLDVLGPR